MKINKSTIDGYDCHKIDFDSLSDFYNYISKTEINETFKYHTLSSTKPETSSGWYGTNSFEEAVELFKNGIPDTSEKLTKLLKAEKKMQPVKAMKRVNSIQGFQPVVPLYLMGVPNNMISTQMKPLKQKVVNLYSSLSYLCNVTSERLQEECIKKFRLISKLESQNYRVNLYVIFGSGSRRDKMNLITSIKIKSANERLNISKLAFPLTHPSMERRLIFRLIEVYPEMKGGFLFGYGSNITPSTMQKLYDGYILPEFITKDVEKISSLDELKFL